MTSQLQNIDVDVTSELQIPTEDLFAGHWPIKMEIVHIVNNNTKCTQAAGDHLSLQ